MKDRQLHVLKMEYLSKLLCHPSNYLDESLSANQIRLSFHRSGHELWSLVFSGRPGLDFYEDSSKGTTELAIVEGICITRSEQVYARQLRSPRKQTAGKSMDLESRG